MIDFDGKLVNPYNITHIYKQDTPLSGGVVKVVVRLACGTPLSEMMTLQEYNEFEEMVTDLIMGEELL